MTAIAAPEPTDRARIDRELEELKTGAQRWTSLSAKAKAELLLACRECLGNVVERWIDAAARAKGVDGTALAGEEAFSGPWGVLRALSGYVDTLHQIERYGGPRVDAARVRQRPNGQVVVDVFPHDAYDRLLLNGIRADVWMQPDVTPATLQETMGIWYRQARREPRVALVLGAGNIASIPPLDVLYKLVADGAVCALKMNPVNDYLGPIFEQAFAPLVEAGYLRFAYGGPDVGNYLCQHPLVDEIHITGSDKTHDAIVFGGGPEGAERKRRNEPLLHKPISSELGNVSPTIVVPGAWSDADIRFQAEHIVTQKLHNDGFNCIASQVVVLPRDWERVHDLVAAIDEVLRTVGDRPAYYPGAAQRCESLASGRTDVHRYGRSGDGYVSRTMVHVDPSQGDTMLGTEAFCSLLGVAMLPGDTETFLRDAVAFANDRLWGTLGGNLIVHPATMRDHASAVERAIEEMRYGCVGVNAWTGVGFLIPYATWGAYPGNTLDNVGSGIGVVHNTHLFSRAQKTVVYAPFAPFPHSVFGYGATLLPKPPWFVTNRRQAEIGAAVCRFDLTKSPIDALTVAALAMGG